MEISTPTSTRDKTKQRSIWRCQYYSHWDMYQLQPVKGNYVFMDLRHNYGPLSINLWCENFTMYELEEIMCQKNDRTFAELLNRFRVGNDTAADLNLLVTRAVTIRRWSITKPNTSFLSNKEKGSRLQ